MDLAAFDDKFALVEPYDPDVGLQADRFRFEEDPCGDSLVAAASVGGCWAGSIADFLVGHTRHEDLNGLVEDDPVAASTVVAARAVCVKLGR